LYYQKEEILKKSMPMNNSFQALKHVMRHLGVGYSSSFLEELVTAHPEPDSLLAVSDALVKYKIENFAVQLSSENLDQIPTPFVVQMNGEAHAYFSCVSDVTAEGVRLLDEKGRSEVLSRKDFEFGWTGISLLLEKTEKSAEPGYGKRKTEESIFNFLKIILGVFAMVLLIWSIYGLHASIIYSTAMLLLVVLKVVGFVIASILLWSEVDRNNSALREFCTGGKNIDCNAVTNSLTLVGGLSISLLAFSYFVSGFLLLFLTGFSETALQLMYYISISSLVIVPFSIYYQKIVIKKWCVLCLWISALFVAELVINYFFIGNEVQPTFGDLVSFGFLFFGILLIWLVLKPYFLAKGELQVKIGKLNKFYSNQDVFNFFMSSSRKISENPEGLGVLLKGESSKHHVLKVCNPYCGPCAKSHPALEELFETGNIDLQILFLPGGEESYRLDTIRHLLAIDSLGDQEFTQKVLDDWYLSDQKDYAAFAAKYPLKEELNRYEDNMTAMQAWSKRENIMHTPTIFVNGYELPSAYSVEDLKYILQ
jgi:hypothetical protein